MRNLFSYDDGAGPKLYGCVDLGGLAELWRLDKGLRKTWAHCKDDGDPLPAFVASISFDDGGGPALWIGGAFTSVEGIAASNLARYRPGSGWEAVGVGMNGPVLGFDVWDDPANPAGPELVAGGVYSKAGGKPANRMARWDGATWHALGKGFSGGGSAYPYVWDDGSGQALYAYGWFSSSGGTSLNNIAKWDGTEWTPLDIGVDEATLKLVGTDVGAGPELFVGGGFAYAGGYLSHILAAWVPCPTCPADLDASGSLDLFDFLTFINLFNASDPAADCDADGAFTFADFTCYSALFAAGCP